MGKIPLFPVLCEARWFTGVNDKSNEGAELNPTMRELGGTFNAYEKD
jgi:hypothetical protein